MVSVHHTLVRDATDLLQSEVNSPRHRLGVMFRLRLFGSLAGPVSRGIVQSVVTSENLSLYHDSAPEASKLPEPPSASSESRASRADIPQHA